MAKLRIRYETEQCSRCHGSGHYSRCDTWKSHCFKCGTPDKAGSGIQFTRRARDARAKVDALKSKLTTMPVQELRAGMTIRDRVHGTLRVQAVTERTDLRWTSKVGDVESSGWSFVVETAKLTLQVANTSTVERGLTAEEMMQVADYARRFKGVLEAAMDAERGVA